MSFNPTYPAYYDPYQQQQQQQYYDYYNSPTAPQPQYAQQQQQYYYPNQPNAPEAYGSQSPYNNPYINGAHAHPPQMPLYTAHSASPYHRPSPPSHMIPNPTRSHTPPSIQHLAPNRFQQASAQSPDYVRRSRSRSNNPAHHQQHIPMNPAHRRTDTTQSQPPLYKTPPQNKRRATTERGPRRRSPQQSATEKPYWKYQNRPTKARRPEYGTSSRQEKPRSPHGRSMSSPPTTKGISGESVKNAYGKRTPNHWALMEDQQVVEPKSTLSPVFEEKQKKLVDAGIDDLIADFNDEEEDDTEQHEEHRDPDSDSDGLPGKGSPPVPQNVIHFPTPNAQRPPSEHTYEARSDAASKISSLDGVVNTPQENGRNDHYDRQYEFEKRALMTSEPKSRYPDPIPPRDIDMASVTTRTDSEPRKRSPSKEIPNEMTFPEIPESVTTPDKASRSSPDKFSNTLNNMATENEDRVNELFDQLKLDSPRMSMGGMDIPDGDSDKPMLEESDDGFDMPEDFPNPFASQKSYFKMIGKDEGSDDSSDKYKSGVGGLVNKVAFDDDDEEKKKSRIPEFTNKQANLILAVLMGIFGILLGGSTIGTDNDWWVWVTIAIVGSGMFITSIFACIFGSFAFWDFEDFKTEFQKLDPVKQSDDIRLEIEAQKRKRMQKYKDEQKKLREERQQIANERMKMQWEMDDMITDFWLLHDENLNLIDWENLGNNTSSDPAKTDSIQQKTKSRRKSTQECLRIFRRLPAEEMEEIIDTYQKMQNQKKKQQKRNSVAGSDAGTSVTSFSTFLSSHRGSVNGRRQSAALSDYSSHRSGVYVQSLEEVNREPRPIVRDQADEMRQTMWESDSLQDERAPLFDGSRIEMTERPKVRFSVSGVQEPSTTPQVTHTQQASFFTQSGSYQHHENQPLLGGTE